jgi:predicted RNA-binding protein YlxR (DUF448 family)
MKKPRKVPMRLCLGCREMKPKQELIRVVRSPEGEISLDRRGKASGRGAYVCASAACLKQAQKTRALERQLEQSISPEMFDALALEIERREDGA